ncbi:efflux RND transporter periplasmic adaptor subunit [Clostridium sp.]
MKKKWSISAMKKSWKLPVIKKSWKIPVIITCVATVVLIGSYVGYSAMAKNDVKTTQYMKLKATKGNIEVVVTASGNAGSSVSKDIVAQNNGVLGSFSVKPGDVVKSGQSIGNIVDEESNQSVEKAKNTLAQDTLKLTQLNESLKLLYVKAPVSGVVKSVNASIGDDAGVNAKNMHSIVLSYKSNDGKEQLVNVDAQNGIISDIYAVVGSTVSKGTNLFKLSANDINNSITSQNLNIQEDKTTLSNAQKQVEYNNLLSPTAGVVAALNFAPGDSIQSSKVIATIIDPTKMQTVLAVDELDINKVKIGQSVSITVDAIKDKLFTGKVIKISSIGITTDSVTTYDVAVSMDAADGVKTGMTTNAKISVQTEENVVMLPIEGVKSTDTSKSVIVQNPGTSSESSGGVTTSISSSDISTKKVQVGIANENYVEVTSGVSEGETVLVAIIKSASTTAPTAGGAGGKGAGGGGGGRAAN